MITLEVAAESVQSAAVAARCGAGRIEFCADMAEGGTTPSYGAIRLLCRELDISVFPIIRPRGGDFVFTDTEFRTMAEDVRLCGEAGCKGVVIGMLHPDGTVDKHRSGRLFEIAREFGMEVTFHRAFDVCRDMEQALEDLIGLGCNRVLTSGGQPTAEEGIGRIARLVKLAAGRISVMPGSGVTPSNAARIIQETGVHEIHGTLSSLTGSGAYNPGWAGYERRAADPEKIELTVRNLAELG